MVAELISGRPPRVWAALGSPCASVFVPLFLMAEDPAVGVPAGLAQTRTADRFATLARSVETAGPAGTARLRDIRAVLDPLEGELWAAADALAGTEPGPADIQAFSADAGTRLDAALTTLGA
jgi:hypothetical protein